MPKGRQSLKKIDGTLVADEEKTQMRSLIEQGLGYGEVAARHGLTPMQMRGLNFYHWKVDVAHAFKQRVDKEGIRSRLDVKDDFGFWFAGLFDGEGSLQFRLPTGLEAKSGNRYFLRATVLMRADNNECLSYIHETLGIGSLYKNMPYNYESRPNSKARTAWQCHKIKDICEVLVPLFERYQLRTKKREEFPLWKEAGTILYKSTRAGDCNGPLGASLTQAEAERLQEIASEMKKLKRWEEG